MKRNVYFIHSTATIREAAAIVAEKHIGTLPVVDPEGKLIGVVGLRDLLSLEMPDFFNLIEDFDFVHNFGAVETTRPEVEVITRPVTTIMEPAISVKETSGMLRAYALMLKRNMHDLPIVSGSGVLVGIVSRVDIGVAILAGWNEIA